MRVTTRSFPSPWLLAISAVTLALIVLVALCLFWYPLSPPLAQDALAQAQVEAGGPARLLDSAQDVGVVMLVEAGSNAGGRALYIASYQRCPLLPGRYARSFFHLYDPGRPIIGSDNWRRAVYSVLPDSGELSLLEISAAPDRWGSLAPLLVALAMIVCAFLSAWRQTRGRRRHEG